MGGGPQGLGPQGLADESVKLAARRVETIVDLILAGFSRLSEVKKADVREQLGDWGSRRSRNA